MRFWHWLFRRRAPGRPDARTSPYRMAPDKLPGAPPPPPPEARTSRSAPPRPPSARRPAKASSNWGLLFGIVGLVGKLVILASSPSPSAYRPPPTYVPPAPATTWDLSNQVPAWKAPEWSVPPLKAVGANSPRSTASATAKLSPAATSSPTLRTGTSPPVTKPLTTPAQAAGAQ